MTRFYGSGAGNLDGFWPDGRGPAGNGMALAQDSARSGIFGQRISRLHQIAEATRAAASLTGTSAQLGALGTAILPPPEGGDPRASSALATSPTVGPFTYSAPLKTCYGFARGLAGNTRLYGKAGAFATVRPNTAAIIPYQFDQSRKAALRPYVSNISGELLSQDGARSSRFHGITDVIDGKSPDKNLFVRDAMQKRFPGQLIIEVPGGQDVGSGASIALRNYPFALRCPTGTGI